MVSAVGLMAGALTPWSVDGTGRHLDGPDTAAVFLRLGLDGMSTPMGPPELVGWVWFIGGLCAVAAWWVAVLGRGWARPAGSALCAATVLCMAVCLRGFAAATHQVNAIGPMISAGAMCVVLVLAWSRPTSVHLS